MQRGIERRRFLRGSAAAILAGVAPAAFPRGLLGAESPNERVRTGHIGVGGMGTGHLNFFKDNVGALCDVDENHLQRAAGIIGRYVPLYKDFRQLLEQKDLDGVVIATPDHWHGVMAVMACEAGKDVYVQKPACNTIEEGRAMANAARRWGRVVQVGSQGRSTVAAYKASEYINNGQIGRVRHVECWHYPNPVGGTAPDSDPPAQLDWDLWIGPNRYVSYNPERTHFNFRWFLDFGGGQIRDRGAHVFSCASFIMGADFTGPVSIEATGRPPEKGLWDTPVDMNIRYEFRNPDWTLTWSQPGPEELRKLSGFGARYWGEKDTLIVRGGDGGTWTEEKAMRYESPAGGYKPYRSPGHEQNWVDCVKSRAQPIMHIESGVRVAALCILGNTSYVLGRKLRWDPVAERCLGDEEANRLLAKPNRAPWRI
jgi:predicted dehydrogenase